MSVRGSFLISNISKIEAILILIFVSLGFVVGYNFHGMVTVTVTTATIFTGDNIIVTNNTNTGDFGNLKIYYTQPRNLTIITIHPQYKLNIVNITVGTNVTIPSRGNYFVYEYNESHIILSHVNEVIIEVSDKWIN
jgi:hypothetical protein